MAKTVNNVKVNTTFTTATAREQLTSGENLCTSLGKINKYLVDLDAGAFTFPANGGNADTVDDKHASDFMQNLGYLTTGNLLDYVLTLTSSGSFFVGSSVTDTPISGLFYGVDVIRHTGGDFVITATRFNGGGVWTNRYNAGAKKWYGWANVADGGNADTFDGLHETLFSRNRDTISDCNNATLPGTYNATPETANTPYATYWLISVETGVNGAWIRQTATQCNASIPNDTYHRLCINGEWSSNSWTKINDGGNAATVNGLTVQTAVPANAKFTDTTYPAASVSAAGLVTTGSQTFAGYKTFQNNVYIQHTGYTKGSAAPSTMQFKAYRFLDNANKQTGEFSNYIDTNNITVSKMLAFAAASLDGKVYSQIATLINADASYVCHVCTTPTDGRSSLRQLASGTAEKNTTNCPSGAWYGKHD